jgi:DNA-binding NarL/FixJ family response regulator
MVILATPSAIIRKRWHQALKGFCPVHEVIDQIGLRHALSHYKPAVLLLDSNAIHHRGIRQVANLQQASPDTRIIVLTDRVKDCEAIAVLKAGASGYCSKTISARSLIKAVTVVSTGEIWADRRLISLFLRTLVACTSRRKAISSNSDRSGYASSTFSLSPRERDIASMVKAGEQNKTISSHLSISEKTVKAHLTSIFQKLGLSSRTQLALFMRDNDFFPTLSIEIQNPRQASLELH